jgi:hypothetical protein
MAGGSGALGGGGDGAASADPTWDATLRNMFDRLDKEKKGYLDEKNLRNLLRDERSFFQGKDVAHILAKFGSNNRLTFEQFQGWWSATYTTYEDLDLGALVEEVTAEQQTKQKKDGSAVTAAAVHPMDSLDEETMPFDASEPPLNSNVAVSRS